MIIGNREVTRDTIFIVAEIGGNHLGNFKLCQQMIKKAVQCGVDAVKLQKRDNRHMFTKRLLNASYNNEFSYGQTYGEHREKLDWFGKSEYVELIQLCKDLGVIFFSTAFDEPSADFLAELNMPCYKIASCDAKNVPLIKYVAGFGMPMLISLGGCDIYDVERINFNIDPINRDYALLHCVSTYPNQDEHLQLNYIRTLSKKFTDKVIGFSSHHPGILPNELAYMCGARIFEMHYTMNRAMGGTDHGFSLETHALEKFCEDVRRIPSMLGDGTRTVFEEEVRRGSFIHKMGKAVHVNKTLKIGHVIRKEDVVLKAPADGIPPYEFGEVIGKQLICEVSTATELTWDKLQ